VRQGFNTLPLPNYLGRKMKPNFVNKNMFKLLGSFRLLFTQLQSSEGYLFHRVFNRNE
jgi:hypothetical protein